MLCGVFLISCEALLIRTCNNTLIVSDAGNPSSVILLDIIATFDILNRGLLLNHLEKYAGLSGWVIQQFKSYYNHRQQFVNIISCHSSSYIVIWSHLLRCHPRSRGDVPSLLHLPAASRSCTDTGSPITLLLNSTSHFLVLVPIYLINILMLFRYLDETRFKNKKKCFLNISKLSPRQIEANQVFDYTPFSQPGDSYYCAFQFQNCFIYL